MRPSSRSSFWSSLRAEIVVQTPDELRSYAVHDDGTFELLRSWGGPPPPRVNVKLWVGDFTANGRGDVIRTGVNATYELDLFLQEADGSMTHVRRDFPESGVVPAGDMVVPAGILDVMADGRPAVFAGGVFDTDPAFAAWRYIDGSWQQLGDPFPFPSGGVLTKVHTVDLDGDGLTDVTAHLEPEGVREKRPERWPEWFDPRAVHLGATKPDGSGLATAITLSPGFFTELQSGVGVGDIDGNGFPDIVLDEDLHVEGNRERVVYWGRGDWRFDGPHAFDHAGSLQDLDGDGVVEIIKQRTISSFVAGEVVEVLTSAELLPSRGQRDINGDGILDSATWVAPPMGAPRDNGRLRVVLSNP